MAINSYSTLQTAIASWLNRDDLTTKIPDFIMLAETRIARKLRTRGVEARDTSITTVAGTQYYTLPTDFLEARNVQMNTNPVKQLTYRTPEQMDQEYPYTASGQPEVFTIIGTEIELKPIPDSATVLEIAYYKKLAALSGSNTTNWLTSHAPDLLLYGSLIESEAFIVNDPRIALWKTLFNEALAEFNMQDDRGRHSGSHLSIRTATGNP